MRQNVSKLIKNAEALARSARKLEAELPKLEADLESLRARAAVARAEAHHELPKDLAPLTTWADWNDLIKGLASRIPDSALPAPSKIEDERGKRPDGHLIAWFGGTGYYIEPEAKDYGRNGIEFMEREAANRIKRSRAAK